MDQYVPLDDRGTIGNQGRTDKRGLRPGLGPGTYAVVVLLGPRRGSFEAVVAGVFGVYTLVVAGRRVLSCPPAARVDGVKNSPDGFGCALPMSDTGMTLQRKLLWTTLPGWFRKLS